MIYYSEQLFSGNKGFYLLINGLDSETCRNYISQIGAKWDYVAVVKGTAGKSISAPVTNLSGATGTDVLKTLTADNLNVTSIAQTCTNDGDSNIIVMGSR